MMLNKNQSEAIVKHIRDIANILENSYKTSAQVKVDASASSSAAAAAVAIALEESGSKRGRKPGAVSDDIRCEHTNAKEQRCKNRATKGTVCGKHNAV